MGQLMLLSCILKILSPLSLQSALNEAEGSQKPERRGAGGAKVRTMLAARRIRYSFYVAEMPEINLCVITGWLLTRGYEPLKP